MRTTIKTTAALIALSLLTTACAQDPYGRHQDPYARQQSGVNKEMVGTLLGAGVGGALGSNVGKGSGRTAAIIGGTLLGAALGNSVGASLDRADLQYYNSTSQQALESGRSGQVAEWRNPDSGNYGTIVPKPAYQDPNGQTCREYTQTIHVGGRAQQAYGTACRQSDGSWQIVQ